ncbi:serine/threonine protein kinase [Saccharothrix saharensis]|uniref:non-specific serine/threonine protein kinase n=1 Tax=Saccharothrix saharensis TaxID=571190 RepID=A0A543J8D9_9PSEU|nr:serine/threonine-protein kinase [Saccharothrix saharensis]TQM79088.1 serine/threonine protein kinase [Saccharothrix saharensis]
MSLATDSRVLAGRYQLRGRIGVGGAAEVHRGWDVLLRRFVAVKVVAGEGDDRRFDNEVRTLAGLSHPGLLSVYDVGTDGGTSFVVLQLVEGTTLRDRLVAGAFTPTQVRALGHQVADTLAHVHDQRVVHRDVKPSNILLDGSDTAFLADFGLARSLGPTPVAKTRGVVVGTASYLAPEQVRGDDVGPPADVYALGLVLLECLTGYREYQGDRVEAAVARLHRPPSIPHDVPAGLARLLAAMTSLSADRRPTAAQVADRLRPAPAALPPDRLLCGVRPATPPPLRARPA